MFGYNVRLAFISLRRTPVLSGLIILGIALGIGVSATFVTVRHVLSRDPIPSKSDKLHYVRMDSWDPAKGYPGRGDGDEPPSQVTYQDAMAVSRSEIPTRQVVMYKGSMVVFPDDETKPPFRSSARYTGADFFEMFETPFLYGSAWDERAEESLEQVVVLSRSVNDQVFGGENSVGRKIRLEDREFEVVGVLDEWQPGIKYYDMTQSPLQDVEKMFVPFPLAIDMRLPTNGNSDGWGEGDVTDIDQWDRALRGETNWLQMWVELSDADARNDYEEYLRSYVFEERKSGRFQRPVDNRVTPVLTLMREWEVVPDETSSLVVVSVLFLALCVLNLVGLLLGKFLARAPEIGVRRALGASRAQIFLQHIVECEVIGLAGGALGLVFCLGLLAWMQGMLPDYDNVGFSLDLSMFGVIVGLALLSGLVAGAYPAWRVCSVPPATHLKEQ